MAVDTWSETALIAISKIDGTNTQYACLTETVDIDIGDKDFDVMNTLCGGRLVKFNPQDATSITLEAYPVEAGTDTPGTSGNGFFDLMNTQDGSQPMQIDNDRNRDKYRMAVLWTDKSGVTDATAAIDGSNSGLRFVAADGYFTSVKPSFTDGVLKYTVIFKVPPFDKAGDANIKMESTDGTATLSALADYDSASPSNTKW